MSLNGPMNMIRLLESNKLEQRRRAAMEKTDSGPKEAATDGWSDRVEDLVDSGDVDGAISLLESIISNLESLGPSSSSSSSSPCGDLRLATALGDLAHLESSRGFSIKADELRTRALLVHAHAVDPLVSKPRDLGSLEVKETPSGEDGGIRVLERSNNRQEEDDDWEAIADRSVSVEPVVSSQQEGESSNPSRVDRSPKGTPRRRGRGSFLYQKSCLYSDQFDEGTTNGGNPVAAEEVEVRDCRLEDADDQEWNSRYGTGHVLVLYDFSPTTSTGDLEKLFDKFQDRGFAIRWVNDTTALAVFRTPSIAREGQNSVQCPFKVRQLEEEDDILTQISRRELEPPIPRPKTSARTAQRLIAQGMGIKLSTDFGSNELRKQETARKNRILARQNMKNDAWGSD